MRAIVAVLACVCLLSLLLVRFVSENDREGKRKVILSHIETMKKQYDLEKLHIEASLLETERGYRILLSAVWRTDPQQWEILKKIVRNPDPGVRGLILFGGPLEVPGASSKDPVSNHGEDKEARIQSYCVEYQRKYIDPWDERAVRLSPLRTDRGYRVLASITEDDFPSVHVLTGVLSHPLSNPDVPAPLVFHIEVAEARGN